MRLTSFTLALLLVPAAACGGGGGGDDDPPDASPNADTGGAPDAEPDGGGSITPSLAAICGEDGFAVQVFERVKACRPDYALVIGATTAAEVAAACGARYQPYLDDGTLELGPASAFAACDAWLADATCADVSLSGETPCASPAFSARDPYRDAAGGMLVGTVAIGGGCFDQAQCVDGAYCDPAGASGDVCDACAARKADGMTCDPALRGADCVNGLCLGVCATPVAEDGACTADAQCAGSLICLGGTCQPLPATVAVGATCEVDLDCNPAVSGLLCSDDQTGLGGPRSCRAPVALGASCVSTGGQPQVRCDALAYERCATTCQAALTAAEGEACGRDLGVQCGGALTCVLGDPRDIFSTGVCRTVRAEGEACVTGVCGAGLVCNRFSQQCEATNAAPFGSCDEPAEVCDNGLDDADLDTLEDCADPECSGAPACAVSSGAATFVAGPNNGSERYQLVPSSDGSRMFVLGVPDKLFTVDPTLAAGPTGITASGAFRQYLGVPTADGGLVAVYTSGADFLKLDASLALQSPDIDGMPGTNDFARVQEAGLLRESYGLSAITGGYAAVGRASTYGFLTIVNPDLDALVLDRRYSPVDGMGNPDTSRRLGFDDVAPLTGGNLALVGDFQFEAMAMVVSPTTGDVIGVTVLDRPTAPMGTSATSRLHDVAPLADGGFVAVGTVTTQVFGDTPSRTDQLLVARFTSTGAVSWVKQYDGVAGTATGRAITVDADGSFVVVGSASGDVLAVRLSSAGAVLATRTYGTANAEVGLGLAPRAGGWAIGGYGAATSGAAPTLFWMVLTQADLSIAGGCTGDRGPVATFAEVTTDATAVSPATGELTTTATLTAATRVFSATSATNTGRCE